MVNRGHHRAPTAMGPILGPVPSGWVRTARLLHPGELDRGSSSSSSTHRLGLLHIIGFFPRAELGPRL